MPVIEMTTSKTDVKMKKQLIEGLMAKASEITRIPVGYFTVVVHEMEDENLGFAGETVADMKARMHNKGGKSI